MNTEFDYYTYNLGGHYLSALINGDTTGLTDEEDLLLDIFLKDIQENGHWDVISEEGAFQQCDISGLHNDCYEVRFYFLKGKQ